MTFILEKLHDRASISPFAIGGLGLIVAFAFGLFINIYKKSGAPESRTKGHGFPLPPGPEPMPVIGNLLDIPRKHEWQTLTKWSAKYGDIVRVTVLGRVIIFVNTMKAANDLFDKRSAIYSDRPRLPLLNEVRVFTGQFGTGNVKKFDIVQEQASGKLLKRLLVNPENFIDHLRLHAGQVIMMSVYGINVESRLDGYITTAQKVMDAVSEAGRPGAFLVDIFPISWFPGTISKDIIKQWRIDIHNLRWKPYAASVEILAEGGSPGPSFVSALLEKSDGDCDKTEMDVLIRDSAALAYGGLPPISLSDPNLLMRPYAPLPTFFSSSLTIAGADTSVATLTAFILAMTIYPEVRKNAQAEIDAVVGASRLPSFSDRKNLPYLTAVMKETMRWHTTAPQALPHLLKEDDVYNGYFLPAGSIIVGNTWGILHDPAVYPDPMTFKPERFLTAEGEIDDTLTDPVKYTFGYGRRICAGLNFAENTLWITMAFILSTLDITLAKDAAGNPIPAALDPSSGLISHPDPFKCSVTARSAQAEALIHQADVF
ncbi:hypothetical protein EW145_g2357 [Phellinidium pouzarii]|uniref:Cytochrome P450 n=1 Tax=Phellinidium pouzarii TaxID=167371 RepID=A0A4S4LGL5_9AGAM|nr:hypothetical protein EW145_g2357 [Phellinidium pouzarii]